MTNLNSIRLTMATVYQCAECHAHVHKNKQALTAFEQTVLAAAHALQTGWEGANPPSPAAIARMRKAARWLDATADTAEGVEVLE